MASPHFLLHSATTSLVLLFIICFLPTTDSQPFGNSPAGPTVAECGLQLMSLAPCSPFVQGTAPSPAQLCCVNLRQVYIQELRCLCLLINDPTLSTVPVNRTLALQLPALCNLQTDISTCSGAPASVPPGTPASQVSLGTKSNSTLADSPTVTVAPRSGITGFLPHSTAAKLKAVSCLVAAFLSAAIFLGTTWSFMLISV